MQWLRNRLILELPCWWLRAGGTQPHWQSNAAPPKVLAQLKCCAYTPRALHTLRRTRSTQTTHASRPSRHCTTNHLRITQTGSTSCRFRSPSYNFCESYILFEEARHNMTLYTAAILENSPRKKKRIWAT